MSIFISDALAAASTQSSDGTIGSLIMLAGFIAIFYFLLWRPQSKRTKEHRQLLEGLTKGDEIVTSGGLLGKISKINDDFLQVSIAEGIEVKVQKSAVSSVLPKGTLKSV